MEFSSAMLMLHEHIETDGRPVRTCVGVDVELRALTVSVGDEVVGPVAFDALVTILERYGKPLADDIKLGDGPSLDLGALEAGARLCILRHRALYDVIARDFVVLVRAGHEPFAELATMISAAVTHIARAAAAQG